MSSFRSFNSLMAAHKSLLFSRSAAGISLICCYRFIPNRLFSTPRCLCSNSLANGVAVPPKKLRRSNTLASWQPISVSACKLGDRSKEAQVSARAFARGTEEVEAPAHESEAVEASARELARGFEGVELEAREAEKHVKRWKPMCLYHTQGLCTYMDNPEHVEKFNHTYPTLRVSSNISRKVRQQPFKYFLVLDLEGMVEILEFPVVMLSSEKLEVIDQFHRFVKPKKMSEKKLAEYIRGKYGRWGLERVWHDTAIPFTETLKSFEDWLGSHKLWDSKGSGKLKDAAFVTCGNWDVKTKIPQQCVTSRIPLPGYFMEWINLKDIYLNFYEHKASGMLAMLRGLDMRVIGTHHVGLDDAYNIARVLQRILSDGATVNITAKRPYSNAPDVQFVYKNRVK